MPTTVNLRPLLDRKNWEACTPVPTATAAGHFGAQTPPHWPVPHMLWNSGTSTHYLYDPKQDAWIELAAGTLGAPAAGSCAAFHPMGPTGTASAGASTTITTALTIPGDLAGYTIRLTGGTGAGQERTILRNTKGANSVITVSQAWTTTPDATTTFVLLTGRFWCLGATGAAVTWKYYDIATGAWSAKSTTSGPGSGWANDGSAVATSGALQRTALAAGTATAGGAATLTNGAKAWTTNKWANCQVRITSGTGAGQIRTINSNTGTVLTVSANWTVNPDATSVYVIEGNDDWIYVAGNNAVTLFRYAINGIAGLSANAQATGDTWITVSPGAARSAAAGLGFSLNWIADSSDSVVADENTGYNGLRIYSFRGGAGAVLDYYDIAANTWTSGVSYLRSTPTFTSGTCWVDHNGVIYGHKEATGRCFKYDVAKNNLDPLSTLLYTHGAAVMGAGKLFLFSYIDGATEIQFLYMLRHTGTELFRMLLI